MSKRRILLSLALAITMLVVTVLPVSAKISPYLVTTEDLLQRVDKVVKPGAITYTSLYNISSIPKSDLQQAADRARGKGGKVFIYFETLIDDEVVSRVVVNPFLVSGDGDLSFILDTTDEVNQKVKDKFEKSLGRSVAVMRCSQEGSFDMAVVLAGKLDVSGMNTDKLVAYSYNARTNKYSRIGNSNCTVDKTGFVYLQSRNANYIIVTDQD